MSPRRRYQLRRSDLNERIDDLIEAASREGTDPGDAELIRQLVTTGVHLLRDETSRAELKLVNSALKELRHAFRVFGPYAETRKVAVFGSARTPADHPDYLQAHAFAEAMTEHGWMAITGAGDGIMGAAQGGAGREASFGVNIRLPFEQSANETIAGDEKLINFRYFFTRKVVFVKEAHAIALFPGGFGTHDEGFEALTLIQTGKLKRFPIVVMNSDFYGPFEKLLRGAMSHAGVIDEDRLDIVMLTDDPQAGVDWISSHVRDV